MTRPKVAYDAADVDCLHKRIRIIIQVKEQLQGDFVTNERIGLNQTLYIVLMRRRASR